MSIVYSKYRDIVVVCILESEIVLLHQVQVVEHLLKQFMPLSLFLQSDFNWIRILQ